MGGDLTVLLTVELGPLNDGFRMKVVRVSETEALLVGSGYALRFSADRDGLELSYIERTGREQLASYTLRPLVMQRFTPSDRAGYSDQALLEGRLVASVRVYASGLVNRCCDVLAGDKAWLRRDGWREADPSLAVERALQGVLFVSPR